MGCLKVTRPTNRVPTVPGTKGECRVIHPADLVGRSRERIAAEPPKITIRQEKNDGACRKDKSENAALQPQDMDIADCRVQVFPSVCVRQGSVVHRFLISRIEMQGLAVIINCAIIMALVRVSQTSPVPSVSVARLLKQRLIIV